MNKDNIQDLLALLQFESDGQFYFKSYPNVDTPLKISMDRDGHIYYKECGITVGRETTCNFSDPENLVVLHCVDSLLSKGYNPHHIELEPAWRLGHSAKGGYADIWIRTVKEGEEGEKDSLVIIECKTSGQAFVSAWNDTKEDGAQLFSYFQQERSTKFLCLYTADIIDGKLSRTYYLVNVQDNEQMLANDESNKRYKDATNNKQLFTVWHDTYHCDFATVGLFEADIEPYRIGKNKYSLGDLRAVDNDTIQKKYNEFALILRQHNVGGHENAFDKLVNLFLAKVVDETNNPNDLHFYWKGSAYDDDYQLQDRLQRLYRDGMKRFLNEDVTYIENSEIEKAFRRFKNDPDATKKTIMEYFRALKFFSENDFSFISVHNKKLFEQNAAILLKVVKMLQDIKLKDSDQNQLLGDLFEGFLNKGVKQSEGQFFTPIPIVRFLVSSLPLENIIKNTENIPNVIDYACGAGHFLTEYAIRIDEFVQKYRPDIPMKEYYAHIYGIEKEYRLSKVSKVSAFMYGHDETNIIYSDALVPHADVKDGTFDILIANPPYSVKGFLETLTESQREQYTLYNENLNIDKNNAIETFFIERAAQLLRAGGVAGIILPVSVLNKAGIYAHAREIILQSFDIIALVELGSGTFGKTGTNTVIMFLRRKETNTPDAEHFRNRVNSWFGASHQADEVYEDQNLLEGYCAHCGFSFDDYAEFLSGNISDSFAENEIIQTYHSSFFGTQRNAMKDVCAEAKSIRLKHVTKSKTQAFRRLPEAERKKEEQAAFYKFIFAIEKEKVYYFILAQTVKNPVLIVKAPSGTSDNKKFLGYEWSDSKGNEGIKYLNVIRQKSDEEEGNEEEDDTMNQIRGINGINTPLFNPADLRDETKINTLIRKNFLGEEFEIPDDIETVVYYSLVDLIDFKRTDFSKIIKTTPILAYPKLETKYPSERLGVVAPYITKKIIATSIKVDSYVTTANMLQNCGGIESFTGTIETNTITEYQNGDILVSNIRPYLKKTWMADRCGGCSNDVLVFRNIKPDDYLTDYLSVILSTDTFFDYMMVGKTGLKMPRGDKKIIPNFMVPKPDKNIQRNIINEYKKVDILYKAAIIDCINIKTQIQQIVNEAQSHAHNAVRLSRTDLFQISIGRRVLKSELVKDGTYDVFSANVFTPFGKTNHSVLSDFSKPSILWGIDGDWMVNYIDSSKLFNPTDHCGVIRVLNENIVVPRYLVYPLLKAGEDERFSRANRASTERIKALTLLLPDIDIQRTAAERIAELEIEMEACRVKMKECTVEKQKILDKYLK